MYRYIYIYIYCSGHTRITGDVTPRGTRTTGRRRLQQRRARKFRSATPFSRDRRRWPLVVPPRNAASHPPTHPPLPSALLYTTGVCAFGLHRARSACAQYLRARLYPAKLKGPFIWSPPSPAPSPVRARFRSRVPATTAGHGPARKRVDGAHNDHPGTAQPLPTLSVSGAREKPPNCSPPAGRWEKKNGARPTTTPSYTYAHTHYAY